MSERQSMYPKIVDSNPEYTQTKPTSSSSSSSSMYPSIDMKALAENLFPDERSVEVEIEGNADAQKQIALESSEEVIVRIPGAIVHLIDKTQSVELASGELAIVKLKQGNNVVAVLARVGDEIQWPLAKDEPAVKLDDSHYFFTLQVPPEEGQGGADVLNYGLTIAAKGQSKLLKKLDGVLRQYSNFKVEKVAPAAGAAEGWWLTARETTPEEMQKDKNKGEMVERSSSAYWTTLAPNVEDYSGGPARLIAAGSGHMIKGILWCGDITVDRLKWGNDFLKKRMVSGKDSNVSPETVRRLKRVKKMTKMSEKVALGVLSGVVKVSGFFTSSVANSAVGKKFFSLLPGEIVLASLDGFNKVCDAVEVAGRNVMSTTAVVTTGLVNHKYGDHAAEATHEGMNAAGHAIGTAWAVFKIRKALNPKSVMKPTTLVKASAQAHAAKLKK